MFWQGLVNQRECLLAVGMAASEMPFATRVPNMTTSCIGVDDLDQPELISLFMQVTSGRCDEPRRRDV
jgi:hypothetical protein